MGTSITHIPERLDRAIRQPWQMRAMAILDALILNLLILAGARVINGEYPVAKVGDDEQTIGFAQVIIVTVLAGLVAWGLLALLERATGRAATIWTAIAVAVFLLSMLGPLGSGVGTSSKVVLALMHIAAAVTIIPLMRRSARIGS